MSSFAPDPHSRARPSEARVTHLGLDLAVDFEHKQLRGTAALDVEAEPGVHTLVLDTRRLAIHAVRDQAAAPLPFTLGPDDAVLGAALTIGLRPSTRRVLIDYATATDAEALQWLEPGQTAGGAHPFLFTQGHAIQSRSWLPIQDSPGVRLTYEARITAPSPLLVLMSAERKGTSQSPGGVTHSFAMREPVPAYLIALAAGDLVARDVGPRTAVFAEPATIDAAAHELGELERMVEAAEELIGPYLWGRFDVVVMPPSFPYGGMENPRLTFASPTLLAGDRSLTTVIVHELAHAWAGNLVTNATWNDFWINEGTTVYLELRLNELLWGPERASLLRSSGHRELESEIERMGAESPDTRLCYDMAGRDPAEGVTVIPYMKGAALFWTLERAFGRDSLDAWLKSWFARRAFQSVTTTTLLEDLKSELFTAAGAPSFDLERWVHAPGLPTDAAPPTSALLERVDHAAASVLGGVHPSTLDVEGFTPQAWRHFLGTLIQARPARDVVHAVDQAFALSQGHNAEILAPWLRLEAQATSDAAIPRIEAFLGSVGRMKYLRPLYAELVASSWGRPIAERAYQAAKGKYHALVRAGLERLFASARGGP